MSMGFFKNPTSSALWLPIWLGVSVSLSAFGGSGPETSSNTRITLHSNDSRIFTELAVPTGYIEQPSLGPPGQDSGFIVLEMTYPEMAPLAPGERTVDFSFSRSHQQDALVGSGRYLRVELHQGRIPGIKNLIDQHIKSDWLSKQDDLKFADFLIYGDKIMNQAEIKGYPILTRYYLPKNNNWSDRLYFQCPTNPLSDDNRLLCQSTTMFDGLLYGGYSFSKSKIGQWREIDAAVRGFVRSLIVGHGDQK